MVSEKFMVNSNAGRIAAATYVGEEFARDQALDKHNAMRLQLLTEETLGMIRAMVDEFYGQIWFEGDDKRFEIHLEATASMDADKKHDLMSVSHSGKNVAVKGFMGHLGELISNTLYNFGRVVDEYGSDAMQYGIITPPGIDTPSVYDMTPVWTLQNYRANLDSNRAEDNAAGQAWDELEKSIVANLADDVIVGVKGDCLELVIVKNL
jgi:hypothetical protein